jgi:two-component system cell cycle sensor histidine kinase/response regulator CckA
MNSQTLADSPLPYALVGRRILLVDDDPAQLKLARAHLSAVGFDVVTATQASEALDLARVQRPDAIVSDVRMSELDGFTLCSMVRCDSALATVPIVLVTAQVDGDDDRKMAVSTGAQILVQRSPDYEVELNALIRVLMHDYAHPESIEAWHPEPYVRRMAAQMAKLLAKSRIAEHRYRSLFDNARDAISILTTEGRILEVNARCEEMMQRPRAQILGHHIRDFAPQGEADRNVDHYNQAIHFGVGPLPAVPLSRPDGTTVFVDFSTQVVEVGRETVVMAIGRDVTESMRARSDLAASESKYRALVENLPDVVWSATLDGKILFLSPHAEQVCGFKVDEITAGAATFWLDRVHPDDVQGARAAYEGLRTGAYLAEYRWQRRDGRWIWIRARAGVRTCEDGTQVAEGTFADITDQKRLEDQLRQAQKMEAIGQLTGGVAHDFNNLLAVILGSAEFLVDDLPADDPRRADVDSILEAGQRAAALTRQLLAFSRRQIVEPRPVNLGDVVTGLEKMLHRVLGEDIEFSVRLAPDLGEVMADAGQIEQVIMNLAINARDAMPRGGRLSIETSNVVLEENASPSRLPLPAGDYVMFAVSDSGCGMDTETQERAFEPFFTTKGVGKGTGLGLPTCYGIVTQCGGHISVYSEVGEGTVFRVYLPRLVDEANRAAEGRTALPEDLAGTETVLVVEDNAPLRGLVHRTLKRLGYRILQAGDGREAVAVHRAHKGTIDLVLTDVIMPGLSGPEVVSQIRELGGVPKVVFMSGYTDHAVVRDQRLETLANFIQKPFTPIALARRVREVLNG